MRHTGVTSRGIIAPILKEGDNLVDIICESVVNASKNEGFALNDGDILGVTESVVARCQGNYVTCEEIAADIRAKFSGDDIGLVFPILSRNRFAILLKAIAMSGKKIYIQLSYPSDEVGNALVTSDDVEKKGVDPYKDNFDEAQFRELFGDKTVHPFTGVDYISYYKGFGKNIEIIFSNDPRHVLKYTKNVLCCDIHTRQRTQRLVLAAGGERALRLDEIMTENKNGKGYNAQFGLLGSNKATEDKVKLFPRDGESFVQGLQNALFNKTGKVIEILVYGDGCFKDPVGGIWELADPVVAPAFTARLGGRPNELKLKYFIDNELSGLSREELAAAMRERIMKKDSNLVGNMQSEGTTPRRLTDLLGSLCDLTSGSGDRGTPIVLVQGYFTNYATE
ncbi:MAG: coenzyme F420-0:L-glutamate ligase [Candidatus Lokiarchaeota archaeon]|nr:coenzyme F420-0:L-glutamate ligase [Candidatus Lokiarchaeota archaeon]